MPVRNPARLPPALLCLLLFAASAARGREQIATKEPGRVLCAYLASLVEKARTERKIGATGVVVVRDGATLCEHGFGVERAEAKLPVDPETSVFLTASIGKLFVATAAAQLVERGRLALDTKVARFMESARFDRDDFRSVTVEQLLTHTSGIEERLLGSLLPPGRGPPSLAAHFEAHPPRFVYFPGEAIRYSNLGVALAGRIVEQVSGLPFDDYADQNIFAPLRMKSSSFRQPLPPSIGDHLVGERLKKMPMMGPYAAGSLATTPADMARFLCAHLEGGACAGDRILSQETEASMQRRRFGAHPEMQGVALGFFESFVNGRRALFHTGDRGHHSILWMLPAEHVGFYLVYESGDGAGTAFRETFTQAFADRLFPAPAGEKPWPETAGGNPQRFVGTYRAQAGSPHTIEKLGALAQQIRISRASSGELYAQLGPGGDRMRLSALGPNLLRSEDGMTVAFRESASGGQTRLDFAGGVSDPGGAVRIAWHETLEFQLPLLAATFIVFGLRAVLMPIEWLWRRWRRASSVASGSGPAALAWRLFGYTGLCVVLGPVLVIAWLASRPFPFTSTPWIVPAGATLLMVGSLLAVAMTALTGAAWAKNDGSLRRRTILALASVLSLGSVPILGYWNLIGYRY